MRGLAGLVAGALLWAAPAAAGPFDDYQLIMWQEHTPAQVEGLKRLGFTGTKLRATGGQISPAELAERQASGLPWYLENIATDFYAPYHRYVPDKPVTWLFDEVKARRRADPADAQVFVREPGLSDPDWLARVAARLETLVQAQRGLNPLFYDLADEPGIADLAAAWDDDIAPTSLAAMREWLKTQYPGLAALNAEWGTRFAGWDQVVPELTDQAVRRTDDNYAAWADFKAWMDLAFARAVRAGVDAGHRADKQAVIGLEGMQLPGWGGYDYSLLAPAVDLMEIYDAGNALELAHAFNPNLLLLRTSFGAGNYEHHAAWQHLLRGGRGMIVWDEADNVVMADGSPGPRGQDLAALAASIRQVSPEVMQSAPSPDPVAVLISQASFRTTWILDRRPGGDTWSDRSAGREYEDNAWRAARRETLQRLAGIGVQPRLLSSAMLEAGALQRDGIRVLILPHAIALSDAEVDAIKAFAHAGGTVLADTEPGRFDGHSRKRDALPLAGIAVVSEPMLPSGHAFSVGVLGAQYTLLRTAGATPRALFLGPDGNLAPGLEVRWLRHDATELLAIQAATPYAAPGQVTVALATPAGLRDIRRGATAQAAQRFTVPLDPFEPTILALTR